MSRHLIGLAALLISWGAATSGSAATHQSVGYLDWEGQVEPHKCYAASKPLFSEGSPNGRLAPFIAITSYRAEGLINAFSVGSGFSDVTDATVIATIDGHLNFDLVPFKTGVFIESGQKERDLLKAMRAGKGMVITWVTPKGKTIRDSYSLMGLTATMNFINDACK